jgi:hypothetical protein
MQIVVSVSFDEFSVLPSTTASPFLTIAFATTTTTTPISFFFILRRVRVSAPHWYSDGDSCAQQKLDTTYVEKIRYQSSLPTDEEGFMVTRGFYGDKVGSLSSKDSDSDSCAQQKLDTTNVEKNFGT